MKIIQSAGGPLLCVQRDCAVDWAGSIGKRFIETDSSFATDYEAACSNLARGKNGPADVGSLSGENCDTFVISMPLRTAVIQSTKTECLIAQVHYANLGWSFNSVQPEFFNRCNYDSDEMSEIYSRGGDHWIFDAAYAYEAVGHDFLSIYLTEGRHQIGSGYFRPDSLTLLTLVKISTVE